MFGKKIKLFIIGILTLSYILSITSFAVDMTYTPSSYYSGSKFKSNLDDICLTGDGRTDVLAVALSQLTYHEGNSDSQMNGANTSGTRNFVEYNVDVGRLDNGEGNGVSFGYAWCASFCNWVLKQARITPAIYGGGEISCRRWVADLKAIGKYVPSSDTNGFVPEPADLIFFKSPDSKHTSTHIGLVLYSDGVKVFTVEGNSKNNDVGVFCYDLTDSFIVGFGDIDYPKVEGVSVDRATYTEGLYSLDAKVTVYTSSDSKKQAIGTIGGGNLINITKIDGEFGYFEKGNSRGWIALSGKAYQINISKTEEETETSHYETETTTESESEQETEISTLTDTSTTLPDTSDLGPALDPNDFPEDDIELIPLKADTGCTSSAGGAAAVLTLFGLLIIGKKSKH